MVVLVDSSADKRDLPRFRPPKVKALRPACLVLMMMSLQIDYNSGDSERTLGRRPSQSLNSGTGSRVLYRLGLHVGLPT